MAEITYLKFGNFGEDFIQFGDSDYVESGAVPMPANSLPMAIKAATGQPFQGRALSRFPSGIIDANIPAVTPGVWNNYAGSIYDTAGTVVLPSAATPGFQRVTASADTVKIYVSSINGNDANDGLSAASALATVNAGTAKLRTGFPDHLLIERGSVFSSIWSQDNLVSGRSEAEPTVYGFYGTGPRPIFKCDSAHTLYGFRNDMVFVGYEFYGFKVDPFSPDYVPRRYEIRAPHHGTGVRCIGGHTNFRFDDCVLNYCEINFQKPSTATVTGPYRLNRCIIKNSYVNSSSFSQDSRPSGTYVDKVTGMFLTECTFYHNGWSRHVDGAGANMFNHNAYWQYYNDGDQMELISCIMADASAHGIQMRAGGLAENNFVVHCPVGITQGHGRAGPDGKYRGGVRVHSYNNVISESRSMRVGPAHCSAPGLCSNAMWGIDVKINDPVYDAEDPEHSEWDGSPSDYQLHNNIVSMLAPEYKDPERTAGFNFDSLRFLADNGDPRMNHSGNIAYKHASPTQGTDVTYTDPERTAGTFHKAIIGASGSTDSWIITCAQRELRNWDVNYSAVGVNDYIRAGFGKTRIAYTWP